MKAKKILILLTIGFLAAQDYPALGSSQSLDVMTWNVENYPKHNQTNSYLIDIIDQINVDIIAFQEIESENSFNNLINQLDGNWVGYRVDPNSDWGELSYAVNLDEVEIDNVYNILISDQYYFAYRPPYVMEITHQGIDYIIINNHFKCCGDDYLDLNNTSDEEYRRLIASQLLQDYVENHYSLEKVIILGDLNDTITDIESNNVFWGFIESENFQFADYDIAYGPSSDWSYPTWPSHLDHIIINNELFLDFQGSEVSTFRVDDYLTGAWNAYENFISDHRPVFMRINLSQFDLGDVNSDGSLDILDVITIVNLVLAEEYNELADVNYDEIINIMDVIIVLNMILD